MRPLDPRLLPHLRPAAAPLAGVVAVQVLAGAAVVGQAFALGALVTAVVEGAGGPGGAAVTGAAAWFAGVTALRALLTRAGAQLSAAAADRVGSTLRRRLLGAVVAEGPLALTRRRSGEVTLLATRGLAALEPYLTRYLPGLVTAVVLPPLTLVAIATQDLPSAAVVALTLPLVPLFAVLIGSATRERAERQWRLLSRLAGHFVDVVTGLRTLVTFGRAEAQSRSIREITRRYRDASRETLRLGFASSVALELVATLSVALVAVTIGLRLASGSLTLGTAMVVLLLAPEAYWPLRRVGAEFHAAAEGTATIERVHEVLAGEPDAAPATGSAPSSTAAAPAAEGLRVEGLVLRHAGREDAVVDGLTADLPAGVLTAVTGPSGCGKSTLLAALVGDLEPAAGTVLVGGVPLAQVRDTWRRQVAWVPQRPWLAPGTVADNLRLGRPDATDDDVRAALAAVDLPASLAQHRVGEDGRGLSAGQRARVALARAVLSGRPWVVLDEPTAHLDEETEAVVLATLRSLADAGRSVVAVAHREAVVRASDHVVALPAAAAAVPSAPSVSPMSSAPSVSGSAPGPAAPRATPVAAVRAVPGSDGGEERRRWWHRPGVRMATATTLGTLSAASGVALTATAGWLVARSAEHPPVLVLMVAIVGVRLFGLARPVLRYAERLLSHDVALTRLAERRAAVYDALVPRVPGALGRDRGDLLAGLVDDVDAEVDHALRVRQPLVTGLAVGALATALVATRSPGAAALLAALTGLAGLAFVLVRHRGRADAAARLAARAELSRRVTHVLSGVADLRLWQAEERAVAAACAVGDAGARAARRAAVRTGTAQSLLVLAGGGAVVLTALAVAGQPGLSGPLAALLVLTPLALVEPLLPLADAGATAASVDRAEARLADLVGRPPRVADAPGARWVPLASPPRVRLEGVVVGWDDAASAPVDLDLAPGSRTALVGPSGSGKSTLAETLVRGLDPVEGRLLLDGHDARALTLHQVRATVGLLDDDPHVFASTLRENLRLARPGADDDALLAALDAVALTPWVAGLPAGLDTWLGEGGSQPSGGERARLGLARLVLSGHPVWVLDEPTAHLDAAVARRLAADVLAPRDGRTVVWTTHTRVGLDLVDQVCRLEPSRAGWGHDLVAPGLGRSAG